MFQIGGDQFQGLEVMELSVSPDIFLGGGEPEREMSPSPKVTGLTAGRATEEACPERKVV